jgi:hypothetical protein
VLPEGAYYIPCYVAHGIDILETKLDRTGQRVDVQSRPGGSNFCESAQLSGKSKITRTPRSPIRTTAFSLCNSQSIVTKMKTSIAFIASSLAAASAFSPAATLSCARTSSSALSATRRESIEQLFGSTAAAAGLVFTSATQPAFAAAGTTKAAQEAEYNELINVLKARSEENQEANKNYAMRANKLSKEDFDDVKLRRPKLM